MYFRIDNYKEKLRHKYLSLIHKKKEIYYFKEKHEIYVYH